MSFYNFVILNKNTSLISVHNLQIDQEMHWARHFCLLFYTYVLGFEEIIYRQKLLIYAPQ